MAILHSEEVAEGSPDGWIVFLHGILGRGQNWRSIARRLTGQRPELGALLVDLPGHGRSLECARPATLLGAARDLEASLSAHRRGGKRLVCISGHSFGGKVALVHRQTAVEPTETWVLDATPGAVLPPAGPEAVNSPPHVLRILKEAGALHADRRAFTQRLESAGLVTGVAQWLAMQLVPAGEGVRFALDLEVIGEFLIDHYKEDLWDEVARSAGGAIRFVLGGRSIVVNARDRTRLGSVGSHVQSRFLDGAGHWLHVDAADALVALLASEIEAL